MQRERTQRAVSPDGTEIVAGVYGQGPPLVLVHGAIADGESEWAAMLPLLTDRFTCYVPSTRGRGDSGHHPDASRQARVGDVTAVIDSIGQPVCVAGVSGGGMTALGAAARTPAVTAIAVHEPVIFEAISQEVLEWLRTALERMMEAAGRGEPGAAIEAFLDIIANEQEAAALAEDPEALEEAGRYLAVDIEELRDDFRLEGPSPTGADRLRRIQAPVLLTYGARTAQSWFVDGCRYVAGEVPGASVREIPEAGHFAQLTAPERLAAVLIDFLEAARQPA